MKFGTKTSAGLFSTSNQPTFYQPYYGKSARLKFDLYPMTALKIKLKVNGAYS
jgi:hypothetical protein